MNKTMPKIANRIKIHKTKVYNLIWINNKSITERLIDKIIRKKQKQNIEILFLLSFMRKISIEIRLRFNSTSQSDPLKTAL